MRNAGCIVYGFEAACGSEFLPEDADTLHFVIGPRPQFPFLG